MASLGLVRSVPLLAAGLFALMVEASATPLADRESANERLENASIDDLKKAYLMCGRSVGQLNAVGIMQCSLIYEELKERAFDGDFHKLLAWSRANSPLPKSGR